jgi:uncharacterized protein (TIGR02588 family)
MSDRGSRSAAEWVTFSVSSLILLVVVALIAVQMAGTEHPAAPVAEVSGPAREAAGSFYVPVAVTNHGDKTVENVQIYAELTLGDKTIDADQSIDFLAGGEEAELEFAFPADPATGQLVVRVSGYGIP